MPVIDFTDAEDPFAPIDANTYRAKVEKVSIKQAKDNAKHPGSDYLAIEFIVSEGQEFAGRHLWMNASMFADNKTIGMLKRTLLSLGYPEEKLEGSFEFDETDLVGKECRLVVAVGTNPETQEKNNSVKRILPLEAEDSILPS
jgi:hypothetical protein